MTPYHEMTREERRQYLVDCGKNRRGAHRGYQHMLEIDEMYPEVDIFGPQCISADVRLGWKDLVVMCCEVLKQNECKAAQIKQKFCGLRFYWDYPDRIEAAMAEWRAKNPLFQPGEDEPWSPPMPMKEERKRIDAIVRPVIDYCESISFNICEDCGASLDGDRGEKCGSNQCDACEAIDREYLQKHQK